MEACQLKALSWLKSFYSALFGVKLFFCFCLSHPPVKAVVLPFSSFFQASSRIYIYIYIYIFFYFFLFFFFFTEILNVMVLDGGCSPGCYGYLLLHTLVTLRDFSERFPTLFVTCQKFLTLCY